MKTFNCGHCGGRHQDLEQVKACSQITNTKVADTTVCDRIVVTTCITWSKGDDDKWVRNAHKWQAPLSEVATAKNICPDHRG